MFPVTMLQSRFVGVYRWRHHLEPLPERLAQRIASLSERLGVRGFSRVFISPTVLQAMAVGYLRPMVLLPAAMVTQIQPEMLEAVIAHELAHIRRFDLWINLAQRVAETLLFYHPGVWWLSICLRSERELCCDEFAVKATGRRLTYATTLESVSRARFTAKQPILAAGLGQNNKPTLCRVRHILDVGTAQPKSRFWIAGVITVSLLLILTVATGLALAAKNRGQVRKTKVKISAEELVAKIIESEKKIHTIQAHTKWYEPDTNNLIRIFDWGYEKDKEYIDGYDWRGEDKDRPRAQVKIAFDGKVQHTFRYDTEERSSSGSIGRFTPHRFSVAMTPKALLGYSITQGSRQTLSQVLLKAKSIKLKKQVEQIQGHNCYILEAIGVADMDSLYDVRIWFDVKRQYRPLKIEIFRSPDNKYYQNVDKRWSDLWKRVANIELQEINGIWFPVKGERYYFKTEKQRYHRRIEMDNVRVNEGISPKRFTVEFPNGCKVYDEFIGQRYVIGELSEQEAALSDIELIERIGQLSIEELIDIIRTIRGSRDIGINRRKLFATIRQLVQIGSAAIPQLVQELNQTRIPQTESILAFTLRAIGNSQAVPGLIDSLGKCGFSSDYGIGKAKTDIELFMKTHQMNPTDQSLGLGCPVREITIALERLTGHTEGHDHFHAYDSQGNRLGSFTVTPEIRDRQRVHRKAVAERWRNWWEQRQTSKRVEGGVLAAPEGSMLEFHIVPDLTSGQWRELKSPDIDSYLNELIENGPFPGSVRGDPYQWYRIAEGITLPRGAIVGEYKGVQYLLLCERAKYVMRPEVEGQKVWGLEKVYVTQDSKGKPAVGFEFDSKGGELFYELTGANLKRSLAIVVNGKVFSAPIIMSALSNKGIITGNFSHDEVEHMAADLRNGMLPVVSKPDVEFEVEGKPEVTTVIGEIKSSGLVFSINKEGITCIRYDGVNVKTSWGGTHSEFEQEEFTIKVESDLHAAFTPKETYFVQPIVITALKSGWPAADIVEGKLQSLYERQKEEDTLVVIIEAPPPSSSLVKHIWRKMLAQQKKDTVLISSGKLNTEPLRQMALNKPSVPIEGEGSDKQGRVIDVNGEGVSL